MLVAVIDGVPAGLPLTNECIDIELARRQKGYGRSERMSIEEDRVHILSGVRFGNTLGSPIALSIPNHDCQSFMDVQPVEQSSKTPDVIPRPGHADLAGCIKYGHTDIRNVLERASARETAARVVVGAVAKRILMELDILIVSHVIRIGRICEEQSSSMSLQKIQELSEASTVRCLDKTSELAMIAEIEEAASKGNTLGGVFEIAASGIPVGLGSYTHWDRRLDGELAKAVMSIPGVKGVEIGLGFRAAELPGSQVHDEIHYDGVSYTRPSNNAGGIEGGVTNGEPIIIRAAMKPIPTLRMQLQSVDMTTKKPVPAFSERSDVCAVPSAAVVGESMTAITLVTAILEKFGGDNLDELRRYFIAYNQ